MLSYEEVHITKTIKQEENLIQADRTEEKKNKIKQTNHCTDNSLHY